MPPSRKRLPTRVLILTERYPPDTWGGAELSLREVLRVLSPDEWSCHVAAFTTAASPAKGPEYDDGLPISRVPLSSAWPPAPLDAHLYAVTRPRWRRRIEDKFRLLKYLITAHGRVGVKARRVCLRLASSPSSLGYVGNSDETVVSSTEARRGLQDIIDHLRPAIIHADNKDSILLLASVNSGSAKRIAMIRDNRFVCAHPEQNMLVGQRVCTSCNAECTSSASRMLQYPLAVEFVEAGALRRKSLRAYDKLLTTSEFLAKYLAEASGGLQAEVVGNPHPDLAEFAGATAGIGVASPPQILFAGNLRFAKGPQILLECIPRILDAVPQARFVFAGRGPLEGRIRDEAKRADVSDRIVVTGFLDRAELFKCLARASVVVAPNLGPEPFGRLPLESAIARKPIVASAVGGYLETIIHEKTGILVPPGDCAALSAAIIELLKAPNHADALGQNAFDHVTARYSPHLVAARISAAWRSSLSTDRQDDRALEQSTTASNGG